MVQGSCISCRASQRCWSAALPSLPVSDMILTVEHLYTDFCSSIAIVKRSCLAGRPIASLAFHIEGDALAVASGHKLYMWQYTKQQQGEEGAPPVALKTRRSLRAVHFHPLGLPLVLTAEVNDVSAPVTLPFGVSALPLPPSPPQPRTPAPEPSLQGREPHISNLSELDTRPPSHAAFDPEHTSPSQPQQDDWAVERRPPRRLSEVFRALMQEERDEELLAQLDSSAGLQHSRSQASASRQILGLTSYSHAQLHSPQGQGGSASLSHRAAGGLGSLPHPVPIRQLRPPSRPRSFHPLRHSIDGDPAVSAGTQCATCSGIMLLAQIAIVSA